jgi:multiple sugar transport system substrate-binding protein
MALRMSVVRSAILAAVLMLIGTACTFGGDGQQGDAGDGGTAGGPVTLRVWTHQNRSFNRGLKDLAEAYTSEHPEVTIEFETFDYDTYIQTLQTALPAGTEADILQMFGTWTCSYADNLAAVPEDVLALTAAEEAFFPGPLNGYVCDDTLYGMPQESNVEYGAILVNTAIAEQAGVSTDGWASFDELIADAQALTEVQDGVITRAGYNYTAADALAHSFLSLIVQGGGDYLNEDGTAFTLNTPEGEQALELLLSMTQAGIVDPVLFNDESNWVGDCYFAELCATGLVGPWVVPEYSADYPEVAANTRYVELPPLEASKEFVADSGWGLTVSNASRAADQAWDFVSFVALDAENAAAWNLDSGTLPALRENAAGVVAEELTAAFPHFETWFSVLPNARFVGQLPDRDLLYYDIIYPHVLGTLQGQETVDEALQAMETEANESFG